MRYLQYKDKKNRNKLFKTEMRHSILKFSYITLVNTITNKKLKKKITIKYLKKKIKYCRIKTRLIKRCLLTNRSRATFQAFKFSRVILRELLSFGIIPGYKKAVW